MDELIYTSESEILKLVIGRKLLKRYRFESENEIDFSYKM